MINNHAVHMHGMGGVNCFTRGEGLPDQIRRLRLRLSEAQWEVGIVIRMHV